ncbi:glycoside hydrolase family 31 protein [Kiritimatiellota bacterium B12222]|nr:glycoside hydrolase family 31 protein [Kiritimatiellota bacterium B12222]
MSHTPLGNPRNIYIVGKARFTFFTDRFIRIEWDEEGRFTDEATFAAVHRFAQEVAVEKTEVGQKHCLKTAQIEVQYEDHACPLNRENLIIHFQNNGRKETWCFGEEDPENLGGTIRTLDRMKGGQRSIRNQAREDVGWEEQFPDNGFISRAGFAVFDDSENVCFEERDGHFSTWPVARPEGSIDLYFMAYGHEYKTALRDASHVFGQMPLPPRYVLGYWYSRYFPFTDRDLRELVQETRVLQMPMDVLVIDMEWHKPGWTGYTWDRSYFPEPEKLLEWLHSQHIKVTLNLHPAAGVAAHEDGYPAFAEAMGVDPATKASIPFDPADPTYMEHYFKILHHPLEKEGIDFWWMDWQQGQSCSIKNLDPLMILNKLHYEDLEQNRPGQRPLIFSRYCGLGSGRYPIGFSGDTYICWESLAFQPRFTAESANILYGYWSHDIGGHYRGELTPELFTRWLQFGLFSPILRVHSGEDRRLWEQDSPYRWIMIEQLRRRYELIPYIYSEMRRGHETAVALCYPLYYDYPEEDLAYQYQAQYMFGEKMLLSPITAAGDPETSLAEQVLWLPEGMWIDTANGVFIDGNSEYTALYTLEQTPVFVRAGTLIPGLEGVQQLDFTSYDHLCITCHRGGEGQYRLYEDDGSSTDYEDGALVTLDLLQRELGVDREITIKSREGHYDGYLSHKEIKLSLPLTPYPLSITLNGQELEVSEVATYEAASLTSVISIGRLDLTRPQTIHIVFPEHDLSLFQGKPGEFAKLLTLKNEFQGLGRSGKVLLDVEDDRFYFDWMGILERISYSPETVLSELETFDAKKTKVLKCIERYLGAAHEVLAFVENDFEREDFEQKFEVLCFNRSIEVVISWSQKAIVTLPKLRRMMEEGMSVKIQPLQG